MITQNLLHSALTYNEYKNLLEGLLKQGKTTGANQSEEYLNFAKINLQRMHRLEKTIQISDELKDSVTNLNQAYVWLVITEGWCGDASQNLPVLNKIAELNPRIELKFILRDENPEIMNLYLTNGAKSIPILICLEKDSLKELFVWGPRPQALQHIVTELLKQGVSKEEKGIITQKWYNEDKSLSLQAEIQAYVQKLK